MIVKNSMRSLELHELGPQRDGGDKKESSWITDDGVGPRKDPGILS